MKFEGQVALITGAGVGLGASISRALASEGATLALCGRRIGPLQKLAGELGAQHLITTCDVTDERQIEAAVRSTIDKFGQLDILVNNAGIAAWIPFEETTTELFDSMLATNLRGAFLCTRYAWPHLKASKGQILNVSSIAGSNGFAGMSAYCASKWGLNGLSETLSIEGQPHGIRVLSMGPAAVGTDIWAENADEDTRSRMMTPEQVADLTLWLLTSPRNIQVKKTVIENFNNPFAE
jgi:NAD(P)-dependent dehydrogenase (short-subunit alcohol dehydrogenase family)